MIIESYAMGRKTGKTTKALETVVELLLQGKKVLFATDELNAEEVWLFIKEMCEDVGLFYLLVYTGKISQLDFSEHPKDLVIVVDTNNKDIEDLKHIENDVYAYYRV